MASCNFKSGIVQRADNFITNQQSFSQIEAKMSTFTLSWVDFSLEANN